MCQLVIHSPQTGSRVEGDWMLTAVPGAGGRALSSSGGRGAGNSRGLPANFSAPPLFWRS